MNPTVTFWKKFLLKAFIVGFVINIVSFFGWLSVKDFSFAFAHQIFAIDKVYYNKLIIDFFMTSKYILLYAFLVPGIALYWVEKRSKIDWKKNIKLDDEDA